MVKFSKLIFLSLLIAVGCEVDSNEYSSIPELTFKSSEVSIGINGLGVPSYLVKLKFYLVDGDGDVGSAYMGDTIYNYFSEFHYVENGVSVIDTSIVGDYIIPHIDNLGLDKTLKAFLYIDIDYQNISYDSVFYSSYIMDRALNKSNVVYSDTLVLVGL